MRKSIEIDDKLLRPVMKNSGVKAKREAVDQLLRTALRLQRQGESIRRLR